ncbi:MAG: hypothetical protein D3923_14860 [Candidatus Electrothrix sp. AR3]|nr:hypothetical protein [Candidatus Electrothrix sp. AR3]
MINDVGSVGKHLKNEINMAKIFIESLPKGTHRITSGAASGGYARKSDSWNWYFAVGGYSAWGKGNAEVCPGGGAAYDYKVAYEFKFYDRYNWDGGKKVDIFGITITDEFMGKFHRQGLAKEFDMHGSVKKLIKWKKGGSITIEEMPGGSR